MNIEERIGNYHKLFPKYPLLYIVSNKRMEGVWYIGKARFRKTGYYGEYPTNYLARVRSLFPDCKKVLHLFSGIVKDLDSITFDCNPKLNPTVSGDVREIEKYFPENTFDLIIADPPYEKKDFEIYGVEPFNKREIVRKCQCVLKNKGFLVWLDLMVPPFSNKLWDFVGLILVTTGTNCRFRGTTILQAKKDTGKTFGGGNENIGMG